MFLHLPADQVVDRHHVGVVHTADVSHRRRQIVRPDDKFVEDGGWHEAAERYENFLRTRGGKVLFLELGVGYNTPVIIKYPFWRMTAKNPEATYACINYGEAFTPKEIAGRSICIDGDIGKAIKRTE